MIPTLFAEVDTKISWLKSFCEIPILGGFVAFILIFAFPALFSYVLHILIPDFNNDTGFSALMIFILPGWNLMLGSFEIKTKLFSILAWKLLGIISIFRMMFLIHELNG